MKKRLFGSIGLALAATLLSTGCLVVSDGDRNRQQCYEECNTNRCYDDCRTYEVCETYEDPWEVWEECWYETACDQRCDTTCTEVCEQENPVPPRDRSCSCDWDCRGNEVCSSNGACVDRAPDTKNGSAGLCQSCETSYDCAESGALCVRLNLDSGNRALDKVCARSCQTDNDCPNNYECVTISREANAPSQCLPVAKNGTRSCSNDTNLECVKASDCARGESCVNNTCEAPSTAECDTRNPCANGKVCRNFKCVDEQQPQCLDRNDCQNNELCIDGQCKAQNNSCVFNEECNDGKCVNGSCVAACKDNTECGNGERCRQGLCEAVECRRSADCGAGKVCVDAQCEQACSKNDECQNGFVCSSHGYCKPDPNVQCRSNAECARDEVCNNGTCATACSCNQQCPTDQVCDMNSGTCVNPAQPDPAKQCNDNCDCPSGQQCNNGQCK